MKRMKKYLWLSFVIVIGCLFFFGKEAEAAKVDFYKRFESGVSDFVDYDFKLNCKCKMTVTMETFAEEDPDDEYYEWENSLLVAIYDESDDELLEIEVN
ncbi:MAG: hypothetical protein HFI37_00080, partial [Lachnospiraceae bacterium]|nr:hypothetical protein [Lachnospiraceae bacterium]